MKKIIETLKKLEKRLRENNIDWVLIGSTSQMLQGMNFEPNDLDISIKPKDIERVRESLKEYKQDESKELPNGQAIEFKVEIGDTEVQFCADYDKPDNEYYKCLNNPNFIIEKEIEGIKIKLLDMNKEADCYINNNHKTEKAQKIKGFINKK